MQRITVRCAIGAALCLLLTPSPGRAGAIRSFPTSGPGAVTLLELPRNDDGSSPATLLPFTADFFGQTYDRAWVNNNGNLTLGNEFIGSSLSQFTPSDLTTNTGRAIIAPFFADVDTRGSGNGSLPVYYGNVRVDGRDALVANYVDVGYYPSATDKLNDFQVLLVDRSDIGAGDFDIEFNYDTVTWETGSASGGSNGFGGNSARAGYSNGSGQSGTFYEFQGSGVHGALLDSGPNSLAAGSLNSAVAGRYVFPVRNGSLVEPGSTQETAFPPTLVIPGSESQPPTFQFNNQPSGRWFDPPMVYGFDYHMLTAGSLFSSVAFPTGAAFSSLELLVGGVSLGTFDNTAASQSYDFAASFGGGVTDFRIVGINPLLDAADPDFSLAFPTFLTFTSGTASFTMTPLSDPGSAIPEPGSMALLGAGLAALVLAKMKLPASRFGR